MLDAIKNLSTIINDIQDGSAVEPGRPSIQRTDVPLTAVVEELTETSGGEITATVDAGEPARAHLGSTGCMLESKRHPEPSTQSPQNALSGLRILLVEDAPDNQLLVGSYLRKAGAKVTVTGNGREALDEIGRDAGFDAVLMDMEMPVMDGHEALVELRRCGFQKPVIALTAHVMTEERRRCLDEGFDDHLAKPIDRTTLVQCLAARLHPEGELDHRRAAAALGT